MKKMKKNNGYKIFTDGCCLMNPGGAGGIAVIVIDNKTGKQKELSEGYISTTNNRMEILAIIKGLKETPVGASVEVYSDSKYAIGYISGVNKRNVNQDLWPDCEKLTQERKVSFYWVKGHNGNKNNERCDKLALEAAKGNYLKNDNGYINKNKNESYKKCRFM